MSRFLDAAANCLRAGGLAVYPTETFYALGCLATMDSAVDRIYAVKGRASNKPLPMIIADWDMAEEFFEFSAQEMTLARQFWPGPLSIILKSRGGLSPQVQDEQGLSAVRMSPHPLAQRLCALAGAPLVSSSANLSGLPPACRPDQLDPLFGSLDQVVIVPEHPWPSGGLPSTLVRMSGERTLQIVREGAVPAVAFMPLGYRIMSSDG